MARFTITRNRVDMLYRIALAECFTSPSERAKYDRHKVIIELMGAGLAVCPIGGLLQLTDDGRDALDQNLDRDRAVILRHVRERSQAYRDMQAKGAR